MRRRSVVVAAAALVLLIGCVNDNVYKPAPDQKMRISQQTFTGFEEYQATIGSTHPGAFAVSESGDAYSYYCKDVVCLSGIAYGQKAISDCRRFGEKCYIFASSNDIKVDYQVGP